LVNKSVGSFFTTIGAEETIWCFLEAKKSRNCLRMSELVIIIFTIHLQAVAANFEHFLRRQR
jgi:hypothetical protein